MYIMIALIALYIVEQGGNVASLFVVRYDVVYVISLWKLVSPAPPPLPTWGRDPGASNGGQHQHNAICGKEWSYYHEYWL